MHQLWLEAFGFNPLAALIAQYWYLKSFEMQIHFQILTY